MRSPRVANVVAFLALFVALGGISWAAIKLPKNSVGAAQIKKNAVTSAKVKNRTLLAKDFKAGQLPAGAAGRNGPAGTPGHPGPQGLGVPAGAVAYERTIVVHPGANADAGGAALRAALASVTDAGTDKKYLIFLEPGIYAIKGGPLQLKNDVSIQGSGPDVTRLLADSSAGPIAVKGAHSLVSDLTLHYGSAVVQDIVALEAGPSTFLRLRNARVTANGAGSTTIGLRLVASSNVSLTDTEVSVCDEPFGRSSHGGRCPGRCLQRERRLDRCAVLCRYQRDRGRAALGRQRASPQRLRDLGHGGQRHRNWRACPRDRWRPRRVFAHHPPAAVRPRRR